MCRSEVSSDSGRSEPSEVLVLTPPESLALLVLMEPLMGGGLRSDVDEVFLLQVERILDKRKNKKGRVEYLVRWRGYGSEGDTWEPEGNLSTCMIYVHDFNRHYGEPQRENLLLRSTRRSPSHQVLRQPCTLLLASTAGADLGKGGGAGSDQEDPAAGPARSLLPPPAGPAPAAGHLMAAPPCGSPRRSMDLSKMGIKILVPKSPMNSRPDAEESPSEAGVQEAHLVPPEVALPEKPAGVQLGPGEERARMGSRPRNPNPLSPPPPTTAALQPLSCPGEGSCDLVNCSSPSEGPVGGVWSWGLEPWTRDPQSGSRTRLQDLYLVQDLLKVFWCR